MRGRRRETDGQTERQTDVGITREELPSRGSSGTKETVGWVDLRTRGETCVTVAFKPGNQW